MPPFDTLQEWLDWQQSLHPLAIDPGLERVSRVARRLDLTRLPCTVITVAGTNGKGSSVAMLDSILRTAGYRTATYTSPHIVRYNERIVIDGRPVADRELCAAFEAVNTARAGVSLTYFEFGTLAAFRLIARARPDIAILEVGMGGRLDAVNLIDADIALVTAIGIDHTDWLGADREAIGREKAGIFRSGRPAVCADTRPPDSLRAMALAVGADWMAAGKDFRLMLHGDRWDWTGRLRSLRALPLPALAGRHQLDNAAGVLQVIDCLQPDYPVDTDAVAAGLRSVQLAGRCQSYPGRVTTLLDVAHNPDGAGVLAACLAAQPVSGRTWLLLGMLSGKDAAGFAARLAGQVDHWCPCSLQSGTAYSTDALAQCLAATLPDACITGYESVCAGWRDLGVRAARDDRIVVTGSFHTVAEVLDCPV